MPAVGKMGGKEKKVTNMKRKNSIGEPAKDFGSPEKKARSDSKTSTKKKKSPIKEKKNAKKVLPDKNPQSSDQEVVNESKKPQKKAKFGKDSQASAVSKVMPAKKKNEPAKEPPKDSKTDEASPDSVPLKGDLLKIYQKRKAERNARCFRVIIRTSEEDEEDEEVEFENAVCVRSLNNGFYFVNYKSEEMAEKMKSVLEERDDVIVVNRMQNKLNNDICINPFRLFIENVPVQTTLEDLQEVFTTASEVVYMPNRCLAHMIYKSKAEAEKVFREADDIEIHGAKMTVLYVDNTPKRNWRKEKIQKIKAVKKKKKQKKLQKLLAGQ
ncbi:nucleolin-like [Penaeus indicus]|uniref:nucleolin-like n=1 Tax=Penaeus indicus TaxID=29960 RepID=UPI00300C9E23